MDVSSLQLYKFNTTHTPYYSTTSRISYLSAATYPTVGQTCLFLLLIQLPPQQDFFCRVLDSTDCVAHPVPLMSINLPPDVSVDPVKLSGLCLTQGKVPKNRQTGRTLRISSPSHELASEAVDHVTDQMSESLRLDFPSPSHVKQQGIEPPKEILPTQSNPKHANSQNKSSHSELTKTKAGCKTPTVGSVDKYKLSVSEKPKFGPSCSVSSRLKKEGVSLNHKPLSWADVASTLPKPKPKPLPSKSKQSDSVSSTSKLSSKTEQSRSQKCFKLPGGTSIEVERHATSTRLSKRPRERRNRRKQAKIAVEQRERLLTRYRSQLEKQKTTAAQKIPAILLPKKKRLTRLKAGILRDRLVRCTLRTLLQQQQQQQQQQIVCSAEESEASKKLKDTIVIKVTAPKVEKIMLPVIPSLEEPMKEMLTKLAGFQDRAFKQTENAPGKRKNTRRIVCGFHEVIKCLKVHKVKFFIVANDLEKEAYEIEVESPEIEISSTSEVAKQQPSIKRTNSLAMTLKQAVDMSREQLCPVVMAFKRRYLQKLCHKGAPISCVGVINVSGAEDIAKLLKERYLRSAERFLANYYCVNTSNSVTDLSNIKSMPVI
nr:hypothetical transcript [Hymenolepis microstoma]